MAHFIYSKISGPRSQQDRASRYSAQVRSLRAPRRAIRLRARKIKTICCWQKASARRPPREAACTSQSVIITTSLRQFVKIHAMPVSATADARKCIHTISRKALYFSRNDIERVGVFDAPPLSGTILTALSNARLSCAQICASLRRDISGFTPGALPSAGHECHAFSHPRPQRRRLYALHLLSDDARPPSHVSLAITIRVIQESATNKCA